MPAHFPENNNQMPSRTRFTTLGEGSHESLQTVPQAHTQLQEPHGLDCGKHLTRVLDREAIFLRALRRWGYSIDTGLEVRDRIGNVVKSAGIPRNGRPAHPAFATTNKAVDTGGARHKEECAGGRSWIPGTPVYVFERRACRRLRVVTVPLRKLRLIFSSSSTPEFADAERTGPLLPSWVVKSERFETTRPMLHTLHKLIDWTRERFSVYTLERRTRGWSTPDEIVKPFSNFFDCDAFAWQEA
ncbi:hypothetical protein EDB86DRAFT_714424 [Lactarius hatsudake]|nr:hypothetical protein EDB86DRAFT_714424 [Lactarius hatsudake]